MLLSQNIPERSGPELLRQLATWLLSASETAPSSQQVLSGGKGEESGEQTCSFQRAWSREACSSQALNWVNWITWPQQAASKAGTAGSSWIQIQWWSTTNSFSHSPLGKSVGALVCGPCSSSALFSIWLTLPSWLVLGWAELYWLLFVAQQRSESLHWFLYSPFNVYKWDAVEDRLKFDFLVFSF